MKRIFPFILLAVALVGLLLTATHFSVNPFRETNDFSFPSFAMCDETGTLTLIDQSQRRVLRVRADGTLAFQIQGGKRQPNSFFYTQEIAVGNRGHLFLLNQVLDEQGFFLIREEIQEYDSRGKYLKTLHHVNLQEKSHRMVQRCWSRSLKGSERELTWFELRPEGIVPYRFSFEQSDTVPQQGEIFPVANAHLEVADVDWFDSEQIVYTLKSGQIVQMKRNEPPTVLYDADIATGFEKNAVPPVPWELEVDGKTVFFVNMTERRIERLEAGGWRPEVGASAPLEKSEFTENVKPANDVKFTNSSESSLTPSGPKKPPASSLFPGDIYRLSASDGILTTCCENSVVCVDGKSGKIVKQTDRFIFSPLQRVFRFAFWGFAILAVVALGICARFLHVHVFHRQPPRGLLQVAGVLLIVVLTLAATLPLLIGRMVELQQTLLLDRLNQMIRTIPMVVDAERIERLQTASDYQSEDYRELRKQLYEIYNENKDPWDTGWYFVLYRVYDDRIFGLMYRNELIGPYYPFTWGEEVDAEYIAAMKDGSVQTAVQSDGMGNWIYGLGPIRNKNGEIVAVFETGTDLYATTLENRKLVLNALLDASTMLIVIVLCLFEFLFFLNLRSDRTNFVQQTLEKQALKTNSETFFEVFLTRPCAFLFFSAVSFPIAFIPLMMKSLYEPIPGFSEAMILASPISVQMLCFGLGTLLAGWGVAVLGIRAILHIGFFFAAAGLLGSAISQEMSVFLLAIGSLGLGTGMSFIGIRSVLLQESDQEKRDLGYSYFYAGMTAGVNVGLVFGAGLADHIGFHRVFAVAFAVLVLAWIFNSFYIPFSKTDKKEKKTQQKSKQKSQKILKRKPITGQIGLFRFLRQPLVLAFFLLHVIPVYAIAAYIYYFFPIFAESEGVGTGNIGRLLILNGLMIIYVGPILGPFLLRKFSGQTAFMLGQFSWTIGTAVIFACFPTVYGAVAALILFGIAEGIVAAGDMSYYLQLDAVKKFGEERAIAVFELVGKVGETLGPILFALALGFGLQTGMVMLGVGCALTLFLLILINRAKNV